MLIYKIRNVVDNKVYIGQTRQKYYKKRWEIHKKLLAANTHHNSHLQRAWNKHSFDKFEFSILQIYNSIEELDEAETIGIIHYRSCNRNFGYNLSFGGDSKAFLPEIRKKISIACTGNRNGFFGRRHSETTKQKLSKLATGRKQSETTIEKKRLRALGKHKSKETKLKMSKAAKGKPKSKEAIENMRIALTGRKLSDSHRNKLAKEHKVSLKSPNGEIITSIFNMKQFCKINNLNAGNLRHLINGKIKSHKGWTLYQ